MMRKHKETYRVCVVTNCLNGKQRSLSIFAHDLGSGKWLDDAERSLTIDEVTSARLRLGD